LREYAGYGIEFTTTGRYVVEDPTLAHLLMMGLAGQVKGRELFQSAQGKRVLLTRSGGFGDILFLTPLIRTLIAAGNEVTVCCHANYKDALLGVDVKWKRYPMLLAEAFAYDREFWLEGVIEFATDPAKHAVDLFAEAARVVLTEGKELSYKVRPEDEAWAEEHFPKKAARRIGVQLMSSSPARTYPRDLMVEVVQSLLLNDDVELALFGPPKAIQLEQADPRLLNVAAVATTFAQSAGVLAECDAVLAPDSAIAHLAGALRLPTVALYGSFPWQARTAYAPTIRALQGSMFCSPCHWHGRLAPFPPDGPCAKTGRCEVLAQIDPQRVVREVMKALGDR
jgi:ADP-heptose:LPS heptosyltransferase